MTRIGSLFSGYGGLDEGIRSVLGGTVAWHSEIDPGARKILAHRYPGVPDLGDITAVDWSAVEPVDVLCGGFPCQDVSAAGKRLGIRPGTRSGLWTQFAYAIDQLRPRLVVIENVRGLLSASAHSDLEPCPWCVGDGERVPLRALGAVLGDLADLGYDANWQGLRAAGVGAPHGRFRVFVAAWPADPDTAECGRRAARGDDGVRTAGLVAESAAHADGQAGRRDESRSVSPRPPARAVQEKGWGAGRGSGAHAADTDRPGREGAQPAGRRFLPDGSVAAHTEGHGRHEGRPEPARLIGGSDAAVGGAVAANSDSDALRQQPVTLAGRGGAAVAGHAGTDAAADATGDPGRFAHGDGGAPAHADGDGLARLGREQLSERDPDGRRGADGDGDEAEPTTRGGELNGLPAEAGPGEALRDVRGAADAQAVQWPAGGSQRVPAPSPLLAELREQQAPGDEGRAPLACSEVPPTGMRGVLDDERLARPSRRSEPHEQQRGELADSLLVVPSQAALAGGPGEAGGLGETCGSIAWGPYEPAIRRWEMVLGRLAPAPTELSPRGTPRLSARFVEWMQGLPAGWVTDVPGLTRNEQLKALGNGVVPQQAAAALRLLLTDARAVA